MLGVGDRVTNDVFEKYLEDSTGFFVDETGDTLDSTTTGETADGCWNDGDVQAGVSQRQS